MSVRVETNNADESSLGLTGLAFIPLLLGMVLGVCTQKMFVRVIRDKTILGGGKVSPESRLFIGMAGAVLSPIGLLWFSLTSFKRMTFIMPMIGMFIFGVGVSLGFDEERADGRPCMCSYRCSVSSLLPTQNVPRQPWLGIRWSDVYSLLDFPSLPTR